jgi:hypothetical protein
VYRLLYLHFQKAKHSDRLHSCQVSDNSKILITVYESNPFTTKFQLALLADSENKLQTCDEILQLSNNTLNISLYLAAGTTGRAVYGVGLRPLACCDCRFESRRRRGCLSIVGVVCCQVEVSEMD